MSNFMFPAIKAKMLAGQFNWLTDPVVAVLIATDKYTPSVHHASLLDIPALARVATSDVLTGRTIDVNTVDADDYLYTSVSGLPVSAVVLFVDSDVPATSWLICYLDQMTGLPFNPSAGPVQLTWSNEAGKIFAL